MAEREEGVMGHIRHTHPVGLPTYTVATAPAAATYTGHVIYVSNGKAGNPVVAFSNGTNWIRVDDGATAIAAE